MSSALADDVHIYPYSSSTQENTTFSKILPELWCQILEHLDPDGNSRREDLISCSLSCRQLVYPSQRLLFRKLTLYGDINTEFVLRKLSNAPHLALHIRQLDIVDLQSGRTWSGHNQDLATLQALCTGVVELSILVREWDLGTRTKTLPDGFVVTNSKRTCESGLLFCALPSLHTIQVTIRSSLRATSLPEFLNSYTGLRRLIVHEMYWNNREGPPEGYEIGPQFSLQSLVLHFCQDEPFLGWISPALEHLTHLEIRRYATHQKPTNHNNYPIIVAKFRHIDDGFRDWVRQIGSCIVDLALNMIDSNGGMMAGLNEFLSLLECTPRVKNLSIIGLPMFETSIDSFKRLAEVSEQHRLASLALCFHVYTYDSNYSDVQTVDSLWHEFQANLKDQNWGAHDYELILDLTFDFTCTAKELPPLRFREIYVNLEERLSEVLHPLSSRNMLRIFRSWTTE